MTQPADPAEITQNAPESGSSSDAYPPPDEGPGLCALLFILIPISIIIWIVIIWLLIRAFT